MHWNILDDNRKKILPLLTKASANFYLAGGTGLALQIGHRDSIDFDFFTKDEFNTVSLFESIRTIFEGLTVVKTQEEKNTLSVSVDNSIKISFMRYPYELLKPLVPTEYFPIASVEDIGCMKLSAITSRSMMKDYVDIYFVLQKISLRDLLALTSVKFPSIDSNLILKSLVYFDDVVSEPIMYKENHDVGFEVVKKYLVQAVRG
jgi:predicted nucleotidyltransferase component of viral defense system